MTMLEKAARAMCVVAGHDDWEAMLPLARAAVGSMAEPSAGMRQAVAAQWGRKTWMCYGEIMAEALREPMPND